MAGICIAVLKGHRDFVRSLAVDATRIVSGDFGGYIRVREGVMVFLFVMVLMILVDIRYGPWEISFQKPTTT